MVSDARSELTCDYASHRRRQRLRKEETPSNGSCTWRAYYDALSERRVGDRETEHHKMADTTSTGEA